MGVIVKQNVTGTVLIQSTWCNCTDCLKLDSHLPKKLLYLLQEKPFKNDEKCFLLNLETSFRFQDIQIFVKAKTNLNFATQISVLF